MTRVFLGKLCEACQQLWCVTSIPRTAILGVAIKTQRGTLINLDKDAQPLRPAIVWPDQRRTSGLKPLGGLLGLPFCLIGLTDTITYIQAETEANWIRTHQPGIWEKMRYILSV